jgi:hypothetical protein
MARNKLQMQRKRITIVTSWLANSILPFGLDLLLPSTKPAEANLARTSSHFHAQQTHAA